MRKGLNLIILVIEAALMIAMVACLVAGVASASPATPAVGQMIKEAVDNPPPPPTTDRRDK